MAVKLNEREIVIYADVISPSEEPEAVILRDGAAWRCQTVAPLTTEVMSRLKDGLRLLADQIEAEGF
jgi:hypothetical protein